MTTLRSYVSFIFEEVLPLFAADTCALISLVGKLFTPPANPDSFLAFVLSPSGDLRDQLVFIILLNNERAGGSPTFIGQ